MVHFLFQLHSLKPLTIHFHYRQLFHFFITITIKRKKPNNIKDIGSKKHLQGYKTNSMQTKRQIINSSFFSSP